MKNVFIISTIRSASNEYLEKLEKYVKNLENKGINVYAPHRDTNQMALGYEICRQNMLGIMDADEVHIFYNSNSQGTHFDMGVAFALNKKIKIVENEPLTEGKSFQRMLVEWENYDFVRIERVVSYEDIMDVYEKINQEVSVGTLMNTSSQRKLIKSRLEKEIIGSVVVTCDESNNDQLIIDMNKLLARVTWSDNIDNKYVDLVFG
jgi:nucleoside 2-deoxyribosyltransferase